MSLGAILGYLGDDNSTYVQVLLPKEVPNLPPFLPRSLMNLTTYPHGLEAWLGSQPPWLRGSAENP